MKTMLLLIAVFVLCSSVYAKDQTKYEIAYKIGGYGFFGTATDINNKGQVVGEDAYKWRAYFWDTDHVKKEIAYFTPIFFDDNPTHGVYGDIAISDSEIMVGWHASEYEYDSEDHATPRHSMYFMWDKVNGLTRELSSFPDNEEYDFNAVTSAAAGYTRVTNTNFNLSMDELNALVINKKDFLTNENAEYTFGGIQDINDSGQFIAWAHPSDRPYSSDERPETYFMVQPIIVSPEPASCLLFGIGGIAIRLLRRKNRHLRPRHFIDIE